MEYKERKKKNVKITTQLLVFFLLISITNASKNIGYSSALTPGDNELSLNERVCEDVILDYGYKPIKMPILYKNSVVQVNITVLPCSNSSVFIYAPEPHAIEFTPILTNFTLAIGESFSENYTYGSGITQLNGLSYLAICTEPEANATVRWWYEVLFSAKASGDGIGIEFPVIFGGLALSTLVLNFVSKRKSRKKND